LNAPTRNKADCVSCGEIKIWAGQNSRCRRCSAARQSCLRRARRTARKWVNGYSISGKIMETLNYYTDHDVSLSDIQNIAVSLRLETRFIDYARHQRLNIFWDQAIPIWAQCGEYTIDEIFLEPDSYDRLRKLNPTTILLFEYRLSRLPHVIELLKSVLGRYGGWIDCKGEANHLYDINTLSLLLTECK
jgi:hypothetical protein